MTSKKIAFFGYGFFQSKALALLIKTHPCIVIDNDKEALSRLELELAFNSDPNDRQEEENIANISTLLGEGSSIVTWKKLDTKNISHIITAIQDFDVVYEICRIARNIYKLQVPIIAILYSAERIEELEEFGVKIINPVLDACESLLNIIHKHYAKPNNIGINAGEIVEVAVRRPSHLVDTKLKELAPTKWRVAAAYREGKFILPNGDFTIQIGDKIVLAGEPKVLENIVNILMVGKPEFPIEYGENFAVLADNMKPNEAYELNYFYQKTSARKYIWYASDKRKRYVSEEFIERIERLHAIGASPLQNFRSIMYIQNIGTLALSGFQSTGILNLKLKYYFKKSTYPMLICKGHFPYSDILISLNGNHPERLIEVGYELAMQLEVPLRAIYISQLGGLKTQKEVENLKTRLALISDYENLRRMKIPFIITEGNPVEKTLSEVQSTPTSLIVVSSNSKDPNSILNPHASFLIATRSKNSVLVIPNENEESYF